MSHQTGRRFVIHRVRGHAGHMIVLVFGMLVSVVLAVAVVGLVAIPARREGRDLLTPKGEEVIALVRDKTGEAMVAARDKVSDVTSPKDA